MMMDTNTLKSTVLQMTNTCLLYMKKIKGKMYLKRIQVIFYSKNTKIYSLQTGIITF